MIWRMNNNGKERQLPMSANPSRADDCFRFRAAKGKWLTDEIVAIEALATERLHAGVSYHSVQTGALALLKLALQEVSGEVDRGSGQPTVLAGRPFPEPLRRATPER